MKSRLILAVLLLMAIGLQTVWAQKIVLHMDNSQSFEFDVSHLDSITFVVSEHEFVDLGLPSGTLWATCNVGASSPEEYGDYFAWGETQAKSDYSWDTYQYCEGSSSTLTKYCYQSDYGYNGFTDNLTELLPEDDAATANWGDEWQMPSSEQIEELLNNTTTTWTTKGDVYGRLCTSSNGNSIFLPAAGYRVLTELDGAGIIGSYWSCSLGTSDSYYPCSLYFFVVNIYRNNAVRACGRTIRPVRVQ